MRSMTLAETKAHLSSVVDQVLAGEEIVITRRNRAVARIVRESDITPPTQNHAWIQSLADFVESQPLVAGNSVTALRGEDDY